MKHVRLVLFDIDGTLMLSGGAGMRAFCRGLSDAFDLCVDPESINPDGKTDPLIARECLASLGQEHLWCEDSRAALFASYLACLEQEMELARSNALIRVLPGVNALLEDLHGRPEFALGLVTGNLERGAQIKLAKAGLTAYFRFGGYGSDSEDRTELIRAAIARGQRLVAPCPVEAAVVIGDTPLDIIHGRAAGASVIGVASARYGMVDLQAHNPDLLVPDLRDIPSILAFLNNA